MPYAAGAAGAPATATHLVRHLEAAGFAAEAQEVGYPIESDRIRYLFAAGRDQAEALRASLEGRVPGGAALPVVDFPHDDPKPSSGPGREVTLLRPEWLTVHDVLADLEVAAADHP